MANAKKEAPKKEEAKKEEVAKSRGIKGVPLTAKIKMLVTANPKREGSKARDRFAFYKDGMTQDEALNAGVTTPDLVYDASHGFIAIDGYSPKLVPKKEKAEKPAAAPKAAKPTAEEKLP